MPTIFNIKSVADALGLQFKGSGDAESLYYKCPFCCDNKGKLNLNLRGNVWRCNKCDEGGGVVHLVEAYLECSREDAVTWLHNNPNVTVFDENSLANIPASVSLADEDTLDNVYRLMLSLLTLKESHRENLHKRGLTDEEIEKFGYKSMPTKIEGQKIATSIQKQGYSLRGIPGFYTSYNIWNMRDIEGYLIPFVNVRGKMTGLQIRTDNPGPKDAKYITFSSTGKTNGTKSTLDAHLVGYSGQDTLFLTEGALKADIASYLSYQRKRKPFAYLAIPGVNNTKSLKSALPELKKMGIKTIWNTFDMDRRGNCDCEFNENVFKGVQKIKKIVIDAGFEWRSLEWDFEKGIDDYLLFLKEYQY